jgi:diguanylate cyclase (GGDEF)-like protein
LPPYDATKIAQNMGGCVRVLTVATAVENRVLALGETNAAERLRLALIGAKTAAFYWSIAEDRIQWDGSEAALGDHSPLAALETGQAFRAWLGPAARSRLLAIINEPSPAEPAFTLEFEALAKVSKVWFEVSGVRIPGPDGRAERIAGVVREITEQKGAFARLSQLATCDELTGQLNRTRLREELTQVLAKGHAGEGRPCTYMVVGIDRLAVINETYGFDVADDVIVATGQRLAGAMRSADSIGRIGGNKFGILLADCAESEMAFLAERLRTSVCKDVIETRAGSVAITVSVGAVWLPQNASTSQEAMLRAEEALERAKGSGRNGFVAYAKSAQRESERKRLATLSDEIMAAVNEDRLILAYQPIVGAHSRMADHHECLLRIRRRDGTIMSAGEFVPAAESLGLVRLIDRRALEMAVAQLYRYPDLKLSINVSGTTAGDSSWLQSFIAYVRENREVAQRMTVELTETAALQSFEENARFVTQLRDMGCRVAIDDFGAGYTSFRNLHSLRVDIVKIDGDYVKDLSTSPDNQLFVRTLVGLAKNFKLETVAEWVGSEEDAKLLAEFGVDFFQGFYFGQPDIAPAWDKKRSASLRPAISAVPIRRSAGSSRRADL